MNTLIIALALIPGMIRAWRMAIRIQKALPHRRVCIIVDFDD